jgi:hypothetical protein
VDGVYGMWMGEQICELRGHGNQPEWDSQQLVDYFADVLKAHDAWVYQGAPESDPDYHKGGNKRWGWIRRTVKQALDTNPQPKVADVLAEIGVRPEEFTRAVFTNKAYLDAEQLEEFEQMVLGGKHTFADMSRHFGISRFSVKTLHTYWGLPTPTVPGISTSQNAPHILHMVELINQGVATGDIVNEISTKFGVTITAGAVSHKRKRMKK